MSGCSKDGPAIDTFTICAGHSPILISRYDVLTDGTAVQIEGYNEWGVANGCWGRG